MRREPLLRSGRAVKRYSRKKLPHCPYLFPVQRGPVVWQVVWMPYYGCTIWKALRGSSVTYRHPQAEWFGDLKKMKKKKPAETQTDAKHLAAMESALFSKLHPLVAHCAVTRYEDGDARLPGWWTVKTMGSAWVVEVKDADTCMRLVVVQQTLDDALTLASVLLESEEAPWEPDQWLTAAKAKKKSK